jgi:hypothetical protein
MNKTFARLFVVFSMIMTLMLAFPTPVHAQSGNCDGNLIMGQSCTLENGDVQDGSLVIRLTPDGIGYAVWLDCHRI